MKLTTKDICLEGYNFPFKESIKHRYKRCRGYLFYYDELVFNDDKDDFGYSKKEKRSRFATKKPYWRKKRKIQRREKLKYKKYLSRELFYREY